MSSLLFRATALAALLLLAGHNPGPAAPRGPLDPIGRKHIPIGTPNALDAVKTFVEAEGSFSPGFGSYGIYFWAWDKETRRLVAPTMDGVVSEHGLAEDASLTPWTRWSVGSVEVFTEVCQVQRTGDAEPIEVVAARVTLTNRGRSPAALFLYAALRPVGPAGGPVQSLAASQQPDTLSANGYPALVARETAFTAGVLTNDLIGDWAQLGNMPTAREAKSPEGHASGALGFDLTLAPGQARSLGFICPVWPGRRVNAHRWDGTNAWAQFDLNPPASAQGGRLQPFPGERYYQVQVPDALFLTAQDYWRKRAGRASVVTPDPRWSQAFKAILSHAALCLNDGAPDVAVANYNVFNRDAVYLASLFQKSACPDLAALAIDHLLRNPFGGRVQPEADNPGQLLWILGEHWRFTRDAAWLEKVYPSARKVAALIRYYRTTKGPHWVSPRSLDFGDALPKPERVELKPGACDGEHPEYTEAFDIAGLRNGAVLADAVGQTNDAVAWRALADRLLGAYSNRFGANLAAGYGSYAVLWPCRLFSVEEGPAHDLFAATGAQAPKEWRYFPLATAHQGLLAGNRAAGADTLQLHFDLEPMRGWFALDEGGPSGVGAWRHARTTWPISPLPWNAQTPSATAMPHGWAIAEFHLLLRDCFVFETDDQLVLLAGVPSAWFQHPAGIRADNLPTHFGNLSYVWEPAAAGKGARLTLAGDAKPPEGFQIRLPAALKARVLVDGTEEESDDGSLFHIAADTTVVEIEWP